MSKRWLVWGGLALTGLLVAGLATLAVVGFAFAQGPTPPLTPWGPGGMMGPGWGGHMGGMGWMHDQMWGTVAQAVGMTQDELWTEFRNGKTLVQIAEAKGITREQLSQTLLGAMRTNMQQAVAQGWMTQAQADAMLQNMQQFGVENMLDHMGSGMYGSSGCHGGPGTPGSTSPQPGRGPGGMMGRWNRS